MSKEFWIPITETTTGVAIIYANSLEEAKTKLDEDGPDDYSYYNTDIEYTGKLKEENKT